MRVGRRNFGWSAELAPGCVSGGRRQWCGSSYRWALELCESRSMYPELEKESC